MKAKLMIHYALSFIVACLAILLINIAFMRSNIYQEEAVFNYYPKKIISELKAYTYSSEHHELVINDQGIKLLESNNMGLQILDENNQEVFQYDKPNLAPVQYSNVSLIDMYNNEEATLFLDEKKIENTTYTYLLFLDSNKIKRITYSYNTGVIEKAHRFPVLIILNIILVIIISFLYTLRITKPINSVINKILDLADGNYLRSNLKRGIYFKVEECLNHLADRLNNNEKEREKLEEMREEWISSISHDIKTPLTSIMGNAEIMADTEYDLADEIRVKCCNTIISKSEYIKKLVEDLNLSTRLKNNTLLLNKKKINIVSLIRHVIIDIINDEKYSERNINFNYCDEEILLEVDEQLMKRVFINLIINAFVHNSNEVKVNINIQKAPGNKVNISIEDNGKGIAEEERYNIFKRYYRGTNTSKKTEGSGLGMAIAHDIVKTHGADIKAISKLGEGLRIDILIESTLS